MASKISWKSKRKRVKWKPSAVKAVRVNTVKPSRSHNKINWNNRPVKEKVVGYARKNPVYYNYVPEDHIPKDEVQYYKQGSMFVTKRQAIMTEDELWDSSTRTFTNVPSDANIKRLSIFMLSKNYETTPENNIYKMISALYVGMMNFQEEKTGGKPAFMKTVDSSVVTVKRHVFLIDGIMYRVINPASVFDPIDKKLLNGN